MQVFNLATGGLDLRVVSDLVGKQMTVVGYQHDALDPVISQHPHASPQMTQHAVDLEPGLGHGFGSRSSNLASKTDTPAFSFRNATRSLRSLMTFPPISSASLPPPKATTLADSSAFGNNAAMPISVIVGIMPMAD